MLNNNLKLAGVFIGTVIGAGFASGQEIIQFFGIYGQKGVWGLLLTSLLFMIIGYIIMDIVRSQNINGYNQLVNKVLGKRLGRVVDIIITLLMFFTFAIMISGSGALLNQNFSTPYWVGVLAMALSAFIVFLFRAKGIADVNVVVVPIIILLTLYISGSIILDRGLDIKEIITNTTPITVNWYISSVVYVSYNSITVLVIFSSIPQYITKKSTALRSSIIASALLLILSLGILYSCLIFREAQFYQIPMLFVASSYGKYGQTIYCIILWLAMFTTAISSGFGLINRVTKNNLKRYKIIALLVCLKAIPISFLGFKDLVKGLYPTFGYIGFVIMACCIIKFISNNKAKWQ